MSIRCECCDLPVESCGKAVEQLRARAERAERERLLASGWLPALYVGICGGCGEHVAPGDPIKRTEAHGWIGACCA